MNRISYACSNNLCLNSCYFEDLSNLTNQIYTSCGDVIKSSKEWRYICSTCPCCQKCLISCEDQCNICLDSFCIQNFNCFQTFYCHRDLNDHIWMDCCNLTSFFDHTFSVCCSSFNFPADRSVYDRCNLFDHFFEISSFFCDKGWICCNTTDHTHIVSCLNIFYLCCVNKKFHVPVLLILFFIIAHLI